MYHHAQLDTCALSEVTLDWEGVTKAVKAFTYSFPQLSLVSSCYTTRNRCSTLLTKGQISWAFCQFFTNVLFLVQAPTWYSAPAVHPPLPDLFCWMWDSLWHWAGLDPASNYQVLVIGVAVMSLLLRRLVLSTCIERPVRGQCWRKLILVYIRTIVRKIIALQDGSSGSEWAPCSPLYTPLSPALKETQVVNITNPYITDEAGDPREANIIV